MGIQEMSAAMQIDRSIIQRPSVIAVVFLLCVLYSVIQKLMQKPNGIPEDVPWVGRDNREWFADLRASFRSFTNLKSLTEEGYRKYSQMDKLFVAPNFLTGPEVLLPPTQISRVLNEPENVLNVQDVHDESLQLYYTIDHPKVMGFLLHESIIRKQLTRSLGNLTGVLHEELELGFAEQWGSDTENWREVNVLETIMQIVARTSNRVFVGAPLCRNQEFLHNCQMYSQAIFGTGNLIRRFPKWTRPVFGRLLTIPNKRYLATCFKHSKPIIMERLELTEKKRNDPNFKDIQLPNDYIQWQIDESYKINDPEEREPNMINRRLMVLNFVAIHTSTMTSTGTILDLYSASPSEGFIEGIREECDRVLAANNGNWTKAALGQMIRLDSAIKETMRHSGLGMRALQRFVKDPEGIDFLDTRVPYGSRVAFPMSSIHHDPALYPEPMRYNAFRFSAAREEWDEAERSRTESVATNRHSVQPTGGSDQRDASGPTAEIQGPNLQKILEFKNNSMVTVSNEFLGFGHGKHACPGRFFASNEIKILIAYMIQNYDVEHLSERPKNRDFVDISGPPPASIRIRRRKDTSKHAVA